MFRIYDKKEKKFIRENIYISPIGDVFISSKKMFGTEKLNLVSSERYVYQKDIGLYDVNKWLIYEGDICKVDRLNVTGVIAYAPEYASYFLFDDQNLKYYPLTEERCKEIEIIGNVFDTSIQVDNVNDSVDNANITEESNTSVEE